MEGAGELIVGRAEVGRVGGEAQEESSWRRVRVVVERVARREGGEAVLKSWGSCGEWEVRWRSMIFWFTLLVFGGVEWGRMEGGGFDSGDALIGFSFDFETSSAGHFS